MKISFNNHTSFGRTIYYMDMHLHDKPIEKLGKNANPEDILLLSRTPIKNGGDEFVSKGMIPSALDSIFYKEENGVRKPWASELDGNRSILAAYENTPVKTFYAVCQPAETSGNTSAIEQVLKDGKGKFVGLKFHPKTMELAADSSLYDPYMKLARKKKLPCLFHSDRTVRTVYDYVENGVAKQSIQSPCAYSRPEQIYTLARRHKDVPVIMGHMGGAEADDIKAAVDAMIDSIKTGGAKLYADISWVDADRPGKPNLIEAIDRLRRIPKGDGTNTLLDGTDRLLFGTDAPLDRFSGVEARQAYEKTVVEVQTAIKTHFGDDADDIIDKIFYKNADELFFKKNWAQNLSEGAVQTFTGGAEVPQAVKKLSKTQIGLIATGVVLAVGAVGLLLYKKFKKPASVPSVQTLQNSPATFVPSNQNAAPSLQNFLNALRG